MSSQPCVFRHCPIYVFLAHFGEKHFSAARLSGSKVGQRKSCVHDMLPIHSATKYLYSSYLQIQ